ncbi:MAG: VOC family protein [Pseudomonadota bacterium]
MIIESALDHIVIGAADLDQGTAYVEDLLGVTVPRGGEHRSMGTHNCVMSLGNGTYLEIIAVNPAGDRPYRPRWFGLDDPGIQKKLTQQPRLLTWVVSVPDISALATPGNFGEVLTMERDSLQWLITVPEDGSLPGNGFLPSVIQWRTAVHPSLGMADLGCSLAGLDIFHQYSRRLIKNLEALEADLLVDIHPIDDHETPYMTASIRTPGGEMKVISSVHAT